MTFPFPQGCPDEALLQRWQALLGRAPRLMPWLDETLRGRRALLAGPRAEVEQILWRDLSRWIADFESLPSVAVSAIAVTLEAQHEPAPPRLQPETAIAPSAEHAAADLETLAQDPAFALARHCVQARVEPLFSPLLPKDAWRGLLHASAPVDARMNAQVAVALVLRLMAGPFQQLPSPQRKNALRVFLLSPADLRSPPAMLERLCAGLPFPLAPPQLPALVEQSQKLRRALPEAASLCGRICARLRARPGGLSLLHEEGTPPASDAEVDELLRASGRQTRMAGLERLLRLL